MGPEFDGTPVIQHPGMEEVLIDGGHLAPQHGIQVLNDGRIPLHVGLPNPSTLQFRPYPDVNGLAEPVEPDLASV
jgi:hypothetical protein